MNTKHISSRKAKETTLNKKEDSFFALVDQYLDELRMQGKIGTADKSKAIFNKFEKFLGSRKVSFYDIDQTLLFNYQQTLKDQYSNKTNTIHSNLKTIRRIFSLAVKRKIISTDADPFCGFELKTEKTNRDFLTEAELKTIAELKVPRNSQLESYRDLFIWTVLTGGLRISDVLMLQKKNVDGNYLSLIIKKTNTPHRIKMSSKALCILQKYFSSCKKETDFVFGLMPPGIDQNNPVLLDKAVTTATARYNKVLKELAKQSSINKKISSHTARITFSTLAVNKGIDMRTVQGILKHSDMEMTAHYSKFIDTEGDKALKSIEEILD